MRKRLLPGKGSVHWSGALCVGVAAVVALACAGATWGASSSYDPSADPYSMAATTSYTGAQNWWASGYTGKGVDVAVIDTGVDPVAGLNGKGQVVYGPDLSFESQNPATRNLDTNGHGTFMASIIAGHDPYSGALSSAPPSVYRGVAPDARIVSVKVGVADGGVDVSQVIAAIDWVVQHAHDPGLNIRVINLSYGTNSRQPYGVDPLAYAVEQAKQAGIAVVAAAGNTGFQTGANAPGLADPAYDPNIIAVGGADSNGTPGYDDDFVASFSANASACALSCRAPDFLAPGAHMQGLRVPGSYVDQTHPEGMLDSRYFRGSGTSEATAFTSGALALLFQKYPSLTPDQAKAMLTASTNAFPKVGWKQQGAGELDLNQLLAATPSAALNLSLSLSTGTGTLEGSRGTDHVSRDGVLLSGEQDIFGKPFVSSATAALEALGSSWSGGAWNGSTWSGSSWSGSSWSGSSWSGSSWSGSSWSGSTWSGNTWSGSSWSGSSWSGCSWSGSSWSGNTWSGGAWQGATWG